MNNTLYKKGRTGTIYVYHMELVELESHCEIRRNKGVDGGKLQMDVTTIASGKNIGKANETTVLQQAQSEYNSMLNELLDEGYKHTKEEARRGISDANGFYKPMLAKSLKHVDDFDKSRQWVGQPKLDGVRALCERVTIDNLLLGNAQEIEMTSREGKKYPVAAAHLASIIEGFNHIPEGVILDGEIYIHGLPFEDFISSVKKEGPLSGDLTYVIYDCIVPHDMYMPYKDRMVLLDRFSDAVKHTGKCFIVDTWSINEANLKRIHDKCVADGYEGLMLKDIDAKYEVGYRSSGVLKYKEFHEDEFEIVDIVQGTGRDSGTAVFVCKVTSGGVFNTKPEGTEAQRKKYWEERSDIIGKKATVKYQNLTKNGIPRFPVAKTVRDYE